MVAERAPSSLARPHIGISGWFKPDVDPVTVSLTMLSYSRGNPNPVVDDPTQNLQESAFSNHALATSTGCFPSTSILAFNASSWPSLVNTSPKGEQALIGGPLDHSGAERLDLIGQYVVTVGF